MTRPSPIPLSPVLLVSCANALASLHAARRWGREGVGFVHYAGYHSHYDLKMHRSSWPIPRGDDCAELAQFAEAEGILSVERPAPGDVFLVWTEKKQRFTQAGIVELVAGAGNFVTGLGWFECHTIEAFARPRCKSDRVKKKTRKLSPECGDRIVRWADLDGRGAVSNPLSREQVELATRRLANAA